MKKFKNAGFGKRLLAYVIDYGMFAIIGNLLYEFIIANKYASTLEEVARIQSETINSTTTVTGESIFTQYESIDGYGALSTAVTVLFVGIIIAMIVYFVVLPLVWEKQTVGRAALKLRLVDKLDEKPDLSALFMRQLLGRLVAVVLQLMCCIGFIVEIVLVLREQPTTIEDLIGGTKMVDLNQEIHSIPTAPSNSSYDRSLHGDDLCSDDSDSDIFDFEKPDSNK